MVSEIDLVAEVGSVHDGSFGNALRLIDTAAWAGATTVKFQTHLAAHETVRDAPTPSYFSAEPRYEYFERTGFSPAQWARLRDHAEDSGLAFMSSPFSIEAVKLLEDIGVSTYKVASGEVSNVPMLEALADTGKPIYVSSGMSSWDELDLAVRTLSTGTSSLVLLQCTSAYPCPPERVGLNVLSQMRQRYGKPVGLSDHTLGIAAPVAAAALGATVIEKHMTFSRRMYGSDAPLASEPEEWRAMAEAVSQVATMLAHPVDKDAVNEVRDMKTVFEKSVVAAVRIARGTVLQRQHLAFKKPGTGIPARSYAQVIGRRVTRDVPIDTLLSEGDFE
jgi:N-acetylneuraminate synthase